MFRAHWQLVLGYLLRRTGDSALAEDLAQETFYKAARALPGWRGGSPTAWLLAIAANVHIDHVRRHHAELPLAAALFDGSRSLYTEVEFRDLLGRLSPRWRQVLELAYLYGFSHAEIAAMAGTSPGAVKQTIYRARRFLAKALEEDPDE